MIVPRMGQEVPSSCRENIDFNCVTKGKGFSSGIYVLHKQPFSLEKDSCMDIEQGADMLYVIFFSLHLCLLDLCAFAAPMPSHY